MIRYLLSPNGRAGREEWWTVTVLVGLAKLCAVFAFQPLNGGDAGSAAWMWRTWAVIAVIDAILLWPLIALNLRRAHDRGGNGLLQAGLLIAGFLADLAVLNTPWDEHGWGLAGVALRAVVVGAPIAIFLTQAWLPGPAGENRYGQPALPLQSRLA